MNEKNYKHVSLRLQNEDCLKRGTGSRPERAELVRMHVLEGERNAQHSVHLEAGVTHTASEDQSTQVQNVHRFQRRQQIRLSRPSSFS